MNIDSSLSAKYSDGNGGEIGNGENDKGGLGRMEKSLDYKGRWRNHTVAFRVSDEEAKLLNDLVALSGLTKQDYITRRLLCRDVVVQGNPRVYKALKNQMAAIHEELKRMESISPDNDELLYTLQVIAITLDGLKGEDE